MALAESPHCQPNTVMTNRSVYPKLWKMILRSVLNQVQVSRAMAIRHHSITDYSYYTHTHRTGELKPDETPA